MLCTPAVRNLIRENRAFEIPNVIDTNRALGMNSLDNAIAELYFNGLIGREDAIAQAAYPGEARTDARRLGGRKGRGGGSPRPELETDPVALHLDRWGPAACDSPG